MKHRSDFLQGIKHGTPIGLGYLSVSCAFGMSVCTSGFPVWVAGLISLTNLTSAGQFAGTSLMLQGAGYAEIALATLIINLRYFLMSLSLSQRLNPDFGTFRRLSAAHGVTDEIFAVAIGQPSLLSPAYMRGLILTPVIGWTAGTVLGGIFSQILPGIVVSAMNIALYAMFIAIIVPPAREHRPVLFVVLAATALSLCFSYIPFFSFLSGGWSIIVIAVIVASLAAVLFPVRSGDADGHADETDADRDASGAETSCADNDMSGAGRMQEQPDTEEVRHE